MRFRRLHPTVSTISTSRGRGEAPAAARQEHSIDVIVVQAPQARQRPSSVKYEKRSSGLTRLPDSMLDASADLGAKSGRTFRSVVLPMIFPSVVAGSIVTFSLSLGDYITAQIVGGKVTMLGNVVQTTYVTNLPFAAAVATIPVVIVLLYLLAVRRSGALENV